MEEKCLASDATSLQISAFWHKASQQQMGWNAEEIEQLSGTSLKANFDYWNCCDPWIFNICLLCAEIYAISMLTGHKKRVPELIQGPVMWEAISHESINLNKNSL